MIRVGGDGVSGTTRTLWRVAALAAVGAIGITSHAEAALYDYWSDSDPGYYRPAPTIPPRPPKLRHLQAKKQAPLRESAKPQGPLIIAISIQKQHLKLYDANGLFAEAPVSTGMKGHPTPTGVFSVIQKQRLHHSNIYSGAPMPYMQRITWSGVAIHAGVLPGYPASHGCIRMPTGFAVKMWNWTKMGARVIISPGEITPARFSHPLLATQRLVPQPVAANEPQADAPPAAKSDKASDADAANKPAISQANLELRSTLGHNDGVKPAIGGELPASAPLREQTHTADASGDVAAAKAVVTMSDAPPDTIAPRREAPSAAAKHDEVALSDKKPAETKSDELTTADIKSGESKKPDDVSATPQKGDATKPSEKPDQGITAGAGVSASAPDPKTDQGRLPGTEKPADAKPDPAALPTPKRTGQIAVFVSRKDSKLYVRQNFSPLFEVPITIAPSNRPLGTHVFTAQVDKDNVLYWSVISLPAAPARYAVRRDEDERAARGRKVAGAVEMKPTPAPDSPAEALDRLSIPADAMARINEALSTGSSIIVSDQGITAGETGEGTDFIVSLR